MLYLTVNMYILKGLNSLTMVGHVDVLEKPAAFILTVFHLKSARTCMYG
jgi:hypothetical protein